MLNYQRVNHQRVRLGKSIASSDRVDLQGWSPTWRSSLGKCCSSPWLSSPPRGNKSLTWQVPIKTGKNAMDFGKHWDPESKTSKTTGFLGFMAFMAFHAWGCLRCIAVLKNGLGLLTSKKHVMWCLSDFWKMEACLGASPGSVPNFRHWCRTCISNTFPRYPKILEMATFPLDVSYHLNIETLESSSTQQDKKHAQQKHMETTTSYKKQSNYLGTQYHRGRWPQVKFITC